VYATCDVSVRNVVVATYFGVSPSATSTSCAFCAIVAVSAHS
jgi:hypothetical protein